jgi:hypothetical protein
VAESEEEKMIGTSKTTKRLVSGLAFAAVVAAIAAPMGLSASKPGGVDPWAVKYVTPGGVNGLPDAWAVKYLTPHAGYGKPDAWQVKYLTPIHIPATLLNPPAQHVTTTGGFDLASFGIGIGAGIGALLVLGAFAVRFGKLRQLASA